MTMKTDDVDRPLVLVEWEDSRQAVPSWQHLDSIELHEYSAVLCVSVGWLLRCDDELVVLAPNLGDANSERPQGSAIIQIPRCYVQDIRKLSQTEEKVGKLKPK